jgi:hypothetical protein
MKNANRKNSAKSNKAEEAEKILQKLPFRILEVSSNL